MTTTTSPPMRVAHYEVIELLDSEGAMRTYRARDLSSHQAVTLKLMLQDSDDERVAAKLAKFRERARLSAKLKHPGIVEVFEYGEDGPLAFIASEFVEGCRLKPQLRIPLADAASVIVQLLEALECAHVQGVAHFGLKPSSLVLTSKGQLKIAGFGVSDLEQTMPSYLAPEQLEGSPLDYHVDLFSTGILFYELLTGNNPHSGTQEDACNWESLPPENYPSSVNPDVPVVFDAICAKALEKHPQDRYSSARVFCEDVHRAFRDTFGSPISRLVSNETVVSMFLATLRGNLKKKRPGRTSPKVPLKASLSFQGGTSNEEVLQRVAQELAAFLGPLANSVVKEAASVTDDVDKLYELVAESLGGAEERRAFLAGKPAYVKQKNRESRPRLDSPVEEAAVLNGEMDMQRSARPQAELRPETSFPPVDRFRMEKSSPRNEKAELPRRSKGESAKLGAEPAAQPRHSQGRAPEFSINSRFEELLGKQPENLAGYLKPEPPELNHVLHAFVAVTNALLARHAEKNRPVGLTPESIVFDRLGNATIRVSSSTVPPGSTLDGAVGSPRYAAPEIFNDKNHDQSDGQEGAASSADIYTLGFMFYEILLGKELFSKTFPSQRSDLDWLRWHADPKSKAPALRQLQPEHPAALSDLLESMMAKEASSRLSEAALLLSRLRVIAQQTDKTIIARPASRPKKSAPSPSPSAQKDRLRKMIALVLFLAACALVVWQNPDFYQRLVPLYHRYFTPHAAVDGAQPSKQ